MGNSGYVIKYPPLHEMAASENTAIRKLHNYLIRLDPEPHKKSFLKPFHRQNTAEVLFHLPQGTSRCAGQQFPMVPWL